MFRPIKMVAKRTAATFDPDILLAVGCDLTQPVASQPGSLSSRPKFQSLDSKSAFQTHEIVIYSYLIYLMLIHVIFKIIKPYHTHIVNHIKLSRLVQNGSASTSPEFFPRLPTCRVARTDALRCGIVHGALVQVLHAVLLGRPGGAPLGLPTIDPPSQLQGLHPGPRGGQLGHDHCQQRVRGVDPNLHRALHQRLASERLLVTSKTPRANNMDGDFCWDSSCGCWWYTWDYVFSLDDFGWFSRWMFGWCSKIFGGFRVIFGEMVHGNKKEKSNPGNTSGIGKSSTNGYYIIHRGLSPACQGARE